MHRYRSAVTRLTLFSASLGLFGLGSAEAQVQPATGDHRTWYFAEGATNDFFQQELVIANPNATAANVTINFLKSAGDVVTLPLTIPATARHTVRVNSVPGLENANSSAVVTSDVDIIAERAMYWPGPARRGGHNAVGVSAPAPKWYFAEGALGFFETYLLIANPSNTAADVTVTYLRTSGEPLIQTLTVPAQSRHTIPVATDQPDAGAFSTVVEATNGVGIIAERAMYWNSFEGGHNAVGVTAPSLTWRFPEGFTGSGFQTFLLLANPNLTEAQVRVVALFDDGTAPLSQELTLAPSSRTTIEANAIPQLQERAFSLYVESLNGQPTVAERAIYYDGFREGNATAGITSDANRVAFANGQEDRFDGISYETFYLLANTTDTAADVTATFYREDGTGIVRTLTVNARSRFTLSGKAFAELSNQRFAAFFESTNGVALSAEHVTYWGATRYGGYGGAGTPWTAPIAAPAAVPAAVATGISPSTGAAGTVVTIAGSGFTRDSIVVFGNAAAAVIAAEAGTLLVSAPGGQTGAVNVTVTTNGTSSAVPAAFTYPAAPPPPPPPPPPNRTPDPPAGQMLPVPNMEWVVQEVARQYPGALRNSCQEHGGSWEFIDRVVARLRQIDTRWGYNCKRGNCPDLSQDVVAYHAGAGPTVPGALQTRTVDIISGHCGSNPVGWWDLHAYGTGPDAARWHNRNLF